MTATRVAPPRSHLPHAVLAGAAAALSGYASAVVLVYGGLLAVGASAAQATSGLLALCVAQGLLAIGMSVATRLPLAFSWSAPGAAVLLATHGVGFGSAVGAFLLAGVLTVLTGAWPALAGLVARVPTPVSGALLAGVLVPLCLSPIGALTADPVPALVVIALWLALHAFRSTRPWAVPAAMALAVAVTILGPGSGVGAGAGAGVGVGSGVALGLVPVAPVLDPPVLLGVGIPLYLVTMAGQNVPGFALLREHGYPRVPARGIFLLTGAASLAIAPFGGHAVNLSAVSAALMQGPEAHPDPARRWIATTAGGIAYVLLGLGSGVVGAVVGEAPPVLIQAVAGLALLGTLGSALAGALADPRFRLTAMATFGIVGSGVAPLGLGSALWGLAAGAALSLVDRARSRPAP